MLQFVVVGLCGKIVLEHLVDEVEQALWITLILAEWGGSCLQFESAHLLEEFGVCGACSLQPTQLALNEKRDQIGKRNEVVSPRLLNKLELVMAGEKNVCRKGHIWALLNVLTSHVFIVSGIREVY